MATEKEQSTKTNGKLNEGLGAVVSMAERVDGDGSPFPRRGLWEILARIDRQAEKHHVPRAGKPYDSPAGEHYDPNVWQLLDRLTAQAEQHADPNVWQVMAGILDLSENAESENIWRTLAALHKQEAWNALSKIARQGDKKVEKRNVWKVLGQFDDSQDCKDLKELLADRRDPKR